MARGNKKEKPNVSYKGYKFCIKPDEEQTAFFERSFGCCRFVWNRLLAYFKENGKMTTPASLKPGFPFLKDVDSLALANVQMDLVQAINHYKRSPKHFGFPKFKKKHCHKKTYTTNRNGKCDSIRVEDGLLYLPKLKTPVRILLHRPLPKNAVIKTATISKEPSGRYYVSLKLESENQAVKSNGTKVLGLDMAMQKLYVDSNGETADYPNYYRKSEEKLTKEQRTLSRMTKGSKNYIRQKTKVAGIHAHIANQRKDFLHKTSTKLANEYDVIAIEDLSMSAMSKSLRLGKSVHDLGWGMFVSMLEYKLHDRGKRLIKADKWFASSQTCSCCGYKNKKVRNLSVREWECPICHTMHDRDANAATNLMLAAFKNLFGFEPVIRPEMDLVPVQ